MVITASKTVKCCWNLTNYCCHTNITCYTCFIENTRKKEHNIILEPVTENFISVRLKLKSYKSENELVKNEKSCFSFQT